jgi:hypothetical protein
MISREALVQDDEVSTGSGFFPSPFWKGVRGEGAKLGANYF